MGVRVDREDAAELGRPASTNVREVEPFVRAVQLQGRARPSRLLVDRVPVEIEVVAGTDVAAGRMSYDVHVRVPYRGESSGGQLLARLPARDMDGGDDKVVARQQLVGVVQRRVGPDLQLAAVQQSEAFGRGFGRSRTFGLLALEPLVESCHDLPLPLHSLNVEPACDRQTDRVIGQGQVRVAAPPGGLGHLLDHVHPVRPVGVAVAIAAQIGARHEHRQRPGQCRLDLAAVLAQLGLDERQAQKSVRLFLCRKGAKLGRLARLRRGGLDAVPESEITLLRETPAAIASHPPQPHVVLLRAGEVDQIRARLARRHDHQVDLRPAQQSDGSLMRPLCQHRLDRSERGEPFDKLRRSIRLGQ